MALLAFQWMVYLSDDGHEYALKVDNDYVNMGERGWSLAAESTAFQYPRGWWPRRVIGITAEGLKRHAIVATTAAELWAGSVQTFQFRDSTGAMHNATVIGRRAERWLRIP